MTITARSVTGTPLRYRILGHPVALTVPDAPTRRAVQQILRGFAPLPREGDDAPTAYTLDRAEDGRWTVTRAGGAFTTDARATSGLLALEWQLATDALAAQMDFFHLHGAALATPDGEGGVLVVGDSGSGKTTLVLALMARGFVPFSDDVTLLAPDTLRLHPFPRAFHVREGTRQLLDTMPHALDFDDAPPGFFLPPRYATAPVPVRVVLFPSLRPGQPPALVPLAPGESAPLLLAQSLTLTDAPARALGTAARITAAAYCARLLSGDLAATADLVTALTAGTIALPRPAP